MTNRPRAIGTAAETAVVRAARANGFPWADRLALHGRADVGDIALCPGAMIEVKGGDMAKHATDLQLQNWLDETARERDHANAAVAFLVLQRPRVSGRRAGLWWAYWRLGWIADLDGRQWDYARLTIARTTLSESLLLLRLAGYGTPIDA